MAHDWPCISTITLARDDRCSNRSKSRPCPDAAAFCLSCLPKSSKSGMAWADMPPRQRARATVSGFGGIYDWDASRHPSDSCSHSRAGKPCCGWWSSPVWFWVLVLEVMFARSFLRCCVLGSLVASGFIFSQHRIMPRVGRYRCGRGQRDMGYLLWWVDAVGSRDGRDHHVNDVSAML
jgi:hypothetical protein